MSDSNTARPVMDEAAIARSLNDLADQVLARHPAGENLALIGIQRRGVFLATRLNSLLAERLGREVPEGILDINLYRDDWTNLGPRPVVGSSVLNFDITGMQIVLVDDVLYTGRTIRAALEALADYGRPRRLELLALVDRGHRELPIQPDYTGLVLDTARDERVDVLLKELDGQDKVLVKKS